MTRRGRVAALVVGGVLALTAAGGAAWWMLRPAPSAADAVLDCFRALEKADAAGVRACGASVDDTQATALRAAVATPTAAAIVSSVGDETRTEVTVSFTLGDEERESVLVLTRQDERWTPGDALDGALTASSPWGTAFAGDQEVPAKGLALLPGVYEVAAGPTAYVAGAQTAAVLPGGNVSLALSPTLTDDAAADAQQQLAEYLTACTAPAAAPPESCGIRIPWGADMTAVSSVAFRIETMPQISLDPPGFAATGGVLVATVTGTDASGDAAEATYRNDAWSVYGDVSFTGDALRLAVR